MCEKGDLNNSLYPRGTVGCCPVNTFLPSLCPVQYSSLSLFWEWGRISPHISNVDDSLFGKVGFEKSSLNLSELSPRLCVYLDQQPDTVGKLHATFGEGGKKDSAL